MSQNVIDSYLVGVKFDFDQASALKFTGTLQGVQSTVSKITDFLAADILKTQVAVTSSFIAMGVGALGFVDHLAMTDQQLRLFGERSMMSVQQARSLKTALDALGVGPDDVYYDKELNHRFVMLYEHQNAINAMLGDDFERQMEQFREIKGQFQMLEISATGFGMKLVSDLFKQMGVGSGDLLRDLERLNAYVLKHLPEWSKEISHDVVPVLKDFWSILGGIKDLSKEVGLEFTNLVGVFSGDDSIEGATFDAHKFARALGIVEHYLAKVVEGMLSVEREAVKFAPVIAGITAGGVIGTSVGSVAGGVAGAGAASEAGPLAMLAAGTAGAAGGGAAGGAVGSVIGGLGGLIVMLREESKRQNGGLPMLLGAHPLSQAFPEKSFSDSNQSTADEARQSAKRISEKTGIAADLIFGQMALETDNFKSRQVGQLNNLSGIRYPGSTEFRKFDSLADYEDQYARILNSSRYAKNGIREARNGDEFARALKTPSGTYYGTGSESDYARGVSYFSRAYDSHPAAPTPISVGDVHVHINQPGSTPDQVQAAVVAGIRQSISSQGRQNLINANSGSNFQ